MLMWLIGLSVLLVGPLAQATPDPQLIGPSGELSPTGWCRRDRADLRWDVDPPWGGNEPPDRPVPWLHVLDVRNTLAVMTKRVSFMRLPTSEEERVLAQPMRDHFRAALREVGGRPDKFGLCVGVPDVFGRGWELQYKHSADVRREGYAETAAARVEEILQPGRYCHGLALDRRPWSGTKVSKFEMLEMLARDVIADRHVLVVRGPIRGPTDDDIRPLLRMASWSAVLPVPGEPVDAVGVFFTIRNVLAENMVDLSDTPLVLLTGLEPAVSALLALEISSGADGCGHAVIQVLDARETILADTTAGPLEPSRLEFLTVVARHETPSSAAVKISELSAMANPHGPRPQFRRNSVDPVLGTNDGLKTWIALGAVWQAQITVDSESPTLSGLAQGVLQVPYPPQSPLGFAAKVAPYETVWYATKFQVPSEWCGTQIRTSRRILLQVDACDWECTVFLNGRVVGRHEGGYDPFQIDLGTADELCTAKTSNLTLRAWDPTDFGCEFSDKPPVPCVECCPNAWQPRGKQSLNPNFIMYSAVTGLWRQVPWLELVPTQCRIGKIEVRAITETEVEVNVTVLNNTTCAGASLTIQIYPFALQGHDSHGDGTLGVVSGVFSDGTFRISLQKPLAKWNPNGPKPPALYEARVSLGTTDKVTQHFGWRTIEVVDGLFHLNGEPYFMHGILYQGYWPETLLTPPDDQTLERDVLDIKAAGFNTIRVHGVVMGSAFYMLCDIAGLLVWQDMPSGDGRVLPEWEARRHQADLARGDNMAEEVVRSEESRRVFFNEFKAMVEWLIGFPCIVVWVVFNEGWGQFETRTVVEFLRGLDPTRLIDAASGWNDVGPVTLGHIADIHNYEGMPWGDLPETFKRRTVEVGDRIKALGEYGGLGYPREGHEWAPEMSWGYGNVSQTKGKFLETLTALVKRLLQLICEERLGAAVYTQWTDVETEINGLLTYDRVPKLALSVIRHEFSEKVLVAFSKCVVGNQNL